MSRKLVICISTLVTIGVILYLARQFVLNGYTTMDSFFDIYVNNAQKYLFNGSLYGVPLIYAFSKPFMSLEYRIRYRKNIAYKFITKAITNAMVIAAWTMLLFIIDMLIIDVRIDFSYPLIDVYVRLVILYAECGVLYYVIYVVTNSEIIAACVTPIINWLILMAITTYNFIAKPLESITLNLFIWYVSLTTLVCFVLLIGAIYYRRKNI